MKKILFFLMMNGLIFASENSTWPYPRSQSNFNPPIRELVSWSRFVALGEEQLKDDCFWKCIKESSIESCLEKCEALEKKDNNEK